MSTTAAGAARASLNSTLTAIQKIYQTTNTPASTSTTARTLGGTQTVSAAMTSYNNNLNASATLALSILSA